MAENEVNITDMIKALQCVASQDADGDCYCDHFNAHLTCEQFGDNTRLDENHMSCGGVLKDTQSCPYSQKTYGVCCEDGELWWLKDVVSILTEIQQYRAIGTVEQLEWCKDASHWKELFKEKLEKYEAIGTVEDIQMIFQLCKDLQVMCGKYHEIGTVEEFKALKEKNTKKRFNIFESHGMRQFVCGYCDRPILTTDNYCSFCGQKLDWQ